MNLKKKDFISNKLFGSYIFISLIAQRSILGNIMLIAFILYTILIMIINKKIRFSLYFLVEILFILYAIWQIQNKISINNDASKSQVLTMIYGLIFGVSLFNFLIIKKDFVNIIKTYIFANAIGVFVLFCLYFNTVIIGRFSAGNMINILGISFGAQSSTSLAYIMGITFFFVVLIYSCDDKYRFKYYFYIIYFIIMILLTGTRKILLLILVTLYFIPSIKRNDKNLINRILKFFRFLFICVIGYFLVMNIDFLYNIVGYRINNMIEFFKTGRVEEGSITTRNNMINLAKLAYSKRPIYGSGLDSFKSTINSGRRLYAHNNYLELLVSGGIVGFIIYYLKYLILICKLFKNKLNNFNKNNKFIVNSFILLFFLILILEYWQVTFIYRNFMIIHIFMLAYLREEKLKNRKGNDLDIKI